MKHAEINKKPFHLMWVICCQQKEMVKSEREREHETSRQCGIMRHAPTRLRGRERERKLQKCQVKYDNYATFSSLAGSQHRQRQQKGIERV